MAKGVYVGVANFTKRNLPVGYTQVEYIQSSGTQYIDTGFKPKYNTRVVVNVSDVATESYLFGARDADSTTAAKQYGLYYNASKNMRSDYFGTNASLAVADASVRATIDKNANIVSLYGSKITNTAVTSGETAYPLWLFAVNNIGSAKANATMKLYSCKIYDNGTLIRDYIPCINPNGVAGLYDMAEGKFYGNAGTGTFTVSTSTYTSVARKNKKGYVGVTTDFPIYTETTQTVDITASNLVEYFEVTNGSYYFAGSGSTFTSNNKGYNSTTATSTWTAKCDMSAVSFNYSVSSESNYDKFTIMVKETTVANAISGTSSSKWSGSLTKGDAIVLTFTKDGSSEAGSDCGTLSDMSITVIVKTQTGTETKSLARKIRKAYIGIGGVARPCWGDGELAYYGVITPLSVGRYQLAATTVGNYAIFAGGTEEWTGSDAVDAYNKSLTKINIEALRQGRYSLAAATVGNYAVFACGDAGNEYVNACDVYDTSLTKISTITALGTYVKSLAAASLGDIAFFAGGRYDNDKEPINDVYALDTSLTQTNLNTGLYQARQELAGTTAGDYAVFAGGRYTDGSFNRVDAFDKSMTRKIPTSGLSQERNKLAGASVGGYAVFAGGTEEPYSFSNCYATVDAYDGALTRIIPSEMSEARAMHAATTVGDFAVFAGGGGVDQSAGVAAYPKVVEQYDKSLTRISILSLNTARYGLAATTVGDYALFAGGSGENYESVVEAFVI